MRGLIEVGVIAVGGFREDLIVDVEASVAITGEIRAELDFKLGEIKAGDGISDVGIERRAGVDDGEGEGGITKGVESR